MDVESKPPIVENPELTNVLPLKPGVGQTIAMHASPTAMNFLRYPNICLPGTFTFILSTSSLYVLTALCLSVCGIK